MLPKESDPTRQGHIQNKIKKVRCRGEKIKTWERKEEEIASKSG